MDEKHLPALHGAASASSGTGQRWYKRLIRADLGLMVFGAAMAALATLIPASFKPAIGFATAALLFVGVVVKLVSRGRKDEQIWFNGRAVAETVKTFSWRYMMRYPPFDDDTTADKEFIDALRAIRALAKDLDASHLGSPTDQQQITPEMRDARMLTPAARRDRYVQQRLNDQITWYQNKAQYSRRHSELWYWGALGFQVAAIVAAFSSALGARNAVAFVGVLSATGAAATAWAQLSRHDELKVSYGFAAQELLLIRELAAKASDEDGLRDAVRDGEGAISREHTMWIAKRGESLPSNVLSKYLI